MDNKSTENTFLKLKQWHTIEAAASLIVLGDVVRGENWHDHAEIQETYKALRDEAYKAYWYSQSKITADEAIEWVKNNPCVAETMKNYPNLSRQDLITAIKRVFDKDVPAKTFHEICTELNNEYSVSLHCSKLKDFESDTAYTAEYVKIAREVSELIFEILSTEADKFGLKPRFYPEKEADPDYSRFYPVSLKPDAQKGYLEVKSEGIRVWLKHNNIHDKFFNPAPEKSETEITDELKPAIRSADDPKKQPSEKVKEEVRDPFDGLKEKYVDQSSYMDRLTERQYTAYSLHKEYNLSVSETARRMNITRQSVYDLIKDAEKNITNARTNMNKNYNSSR